MLATSIFIETPEHVFTRRKTTCSGHDGYAFSPKTLFQVQLMQSQAVKNCI